MIYQLLIRPKHIYLRRRGSAQVVAIGAELGLPVLPPASGKPAGGEGCCRDLAVVVSRRSVTEWL
jgi:hypothetical protein